MGENNFSSKNTVRRVFETLYGTADSEEAINAALKFIGEENKVSRVYIFEDTADHKHCRNTFEWCAEGISPEKK